MSATGPVDPRRSTVEAAAVADDPATPPLDRVLALPHRAGANVKGELVGVAWTWLLPDPAPTRVLVVGRVTERALGMLRAGGTEVIEVADDGPDLASVGAVGPVDVAWLGAEPDDGLRRIADAPADWCRPAVVVAGMAASEDAPPAWPHPLSDGVEVATAVFRTRPDLTDVRSAVPNDDPQAEAFLRERGLLPRSPGDGGPGRWRSARSGATGGSVCHVVIRSTSELAPPPAWLRRMAAEDGQDLTGWRFAFAAPGVYNTQKLLAFLAPAGATDATIVVKATRDAAAGARLDNERDGLERLAALGDLTAGRTPRVRFSGSVAGRVVVGEEAMPGRTLRALGAADVADPRITDAIDWLTTLATATRLARPAGVVAGPLTELVGRWVDLTGPEAALRRRVDADLARIAASQAPIPTIVQHGDPGTWNLVSTAGGPVAFLDWENFEPAGLPGWDVAYLLRSAVAGSPGTLRRVRDRLSGGRAVAIARRFDQAARPGGPVDRSLRRYAQAVDLEPGIAASIVRLGWVYQALKEATRLPAGQGARAAHQQMLRVGGWDPGRRGGGPA
jgi:hypothetical protein